ncbi:MAG: hypothetical protein IH964_06835 [Candidatus Dadabacteria bacterium]|nr:hypothetical protein [Candidatus Dadabacteria bacterium]
MPKKLTDPDENIKLKSAVTILTQQRNNAAVEKVIKQINLSTNIKKKLDTAIENAKKAEGNADKAVGLIEFSNQLIIIAVDTIDLKVRGLLQNIDSKIDLDKIIKSISTSAKKEEPTKETISEIEQGFMEKKRKKELCEKDSGNNINESALICILELQSQTNKINTDSAQYISFAENMTKCPDDVK